MKAFAIVERRRERVANNQEPDAPESELNDDILNMKEEFKEAINEQLERQRVALKHYVYNGPNPIVPLTFGSPAPTLMYDNNATMPPAMQQEDFDALDIAHGFKSSVDKLKRKNDQLEKENNGDEQPKKEKEHGH